MNLSLGLFSNRSMLTIFISFSTIDGQDVAEHIHSSYKKKLDTRYFFRQKRSLMLEQKLLDVNHPDHTIIVYPGHGHFLTNIGEDSWIDLPGPVPDYILEDIYSWLIDPDRKLSRQSDMSVELSALA